MECGKQRLQQVDLVLQVATGAFLCFRKLSIRRPREEHDLFPLQRMSSRTEPRAALWAKLNLIQSGFH